MSRENLPDSKFYDVEAIIRPSRIQQVSSALLKIGVRGLIVSDVLEFVGAQGVSTERHGGSDFFKANFVAKVKCEILVSKDQKESVINTIIDGARIGETGDGIIFVEPVWINILGERGEKAEKMTGDMLSYEIEDRLTLDIPNQHDQPQDHPNLLPVTKYKVEAIVSSLRFLQVYSALLRTGIQDVNVYEVQEAFLRFGAQRLSTERHNAFKMEIIVSNDQVESVIHTITGGARTGHMGDDKIFVVPVLNIVDVLNEIHGQANQPMVEHRDHPDPQNLDEIDWSDIDTVLKDINLDQLQEIHQQATDYQHNEHPHAGEANTQYVPQLETTLVGQPQPPLLQRDFSTSH